MKHDLMLFFKMKLITKLMDNMDLTDGSHKIFCNVFNISIDTNKKWCLSPAVVEVLEKSFNENNIIQKIGTEEYDDLCGIYDSTDEVFFNLTNKKDKITMFSNGKNFIYFNTQEDIKSEKYIEAYKRFVFNDKQAKDDKYIYNLSSWLI